MNKDDNLVVCPECGGSLIYEEFFQVGHVYKINGKTGKMSKKWKRTEENSEEAQMLYCEKCGNVIYDYSITPPPENVVTIHYNE